MKFKYMSIGILAAVTLILMSGESFARTQFTVRHQRQEAGIAQAAGQGKLTPAESVRLNREQERIERTARLTSRDGRVSPYEYRALTKTRLRAAEHIRRAANNRYVYCPTPYGPPAFWGNRCRPSSGFGVFFSGTWVLPKGFFSFSTGGE